ncbi:hypothetical protein [Thalassoglobus neptunius]|uniref:hypothetical protein n=1 Tax=Thalassoglobus neptunius TaxID=1938619 RepID=UPI0011B64D8C|nr:hypothetical protein [Thalassoglobus neptunius]
MRIPSPKPTPTASLEAVDPSLADTDEFDVYDPNSAPPVEAKEKPPQESGDPKPSNPLLQTTTEFNLSEATSGSTPENAAEPFPLISPEPRPLTSRPSRRRRKSRWGMLLPPLFFGGLLVLLGVIYSFQTRPVFTGTIQGERLPADHILRMELKAEDFSIPEERFNTVLEQLKETPTTVRSNLVVLDLSANGNKLQMTLSPGRQAEFVKAPLLSLSDINTFYQDQFRDLEQQRFQELKSGINRMFEEWSDPQASSQNALLPEYRQSVVYNTFVSGLGRICHAVEELTAYPCVHESQSGDFYFLVPIGTETFTIHERKADGAISVFPSEFAVKVNVAPQTAEDLEIEVETHEAESEDPTDMESETSDDSTSDDSTSGMESPMELDSDSETSEQ